MACKDCGKKRLVVGDVTNERWYRFAMSPVSGIEVRTWGDYTPTQAALIGEWVKRMLQLALLDRVDPNGK
jgi:hypothetical protein